MDFIYKVETYVRTGVIPQDLGKGLISFYESYSEAVLQNHGEKDSFLPILNQFLDFVTEQLKNPTPFEPYHKRIPFYTKFGTDFIRPLVILDKSKVVGLENLNEILSLLKKGDNVILFANHQTEPDPQAISLLLENIDHTLSEEMIFVAGHRVTTDPLTIPFSLGRNLLCIYSKNYIEHPPELKNEKLLHNKSTMSKMSELLAQGGKCIYVAPSGGRDRPDQNGIVKVAPFDPSSIEMFRLMAERAGHPTHFFPLALWTYPLLPPPHAITKELGEKRHTQCTPIHLAFGPKIDMDSIDHPDKKEKRLLRANFIWNVVNEHYKLIDLK